MATNIPVTGGGAALILLSLQQGYRLYYESSPMVPPQIANNVVALLAAFRQLPGPPIVHMREDQPDPQSYLNYRNPGHAFETWATPFQGETVLSKTTLDGFLMTELHEVLHRGAIRTVVLIGYITDKDVNATAISAKNRGYNVIIVPDATATWGEPDDGLTAMQAWHDALRAYAANGISLKSTAVLLNELTAR
ncbi:Isochorismatase hydrolase [Calocera cornea HHB12733]|uniref:Isochorismatase hydrolase n=1 Tax=Calocera cornea HHB12733 TaxID=1353952 RepID=A0A165DJC0_9BASI|nr:Isochorismatase hydrolase [Calocera cornea HHB12733]